MELDAVSGFATLIWAPTGFALATLLLFGQNLWPGILIGAFVVNYVHGATFLSALGISIGNTLEATVGIYFLTSWQDFHKSFDRLKDVLLFFVLACMLSTTVSATLGVFSLWFFGDLKESILITWETWWIGDALGNLLVAPLILCWGTTYFKKDLTIWKILEALLLLGGLIGTSYWVFNRSTPAFWFFPFVVWGALGFGQVGAVTVAFIISVIAIVATSHGMGPFAQGTLRINLFLLNCFMIVFTSTGMILAAVFTERRKAMLALKDAIKTRDEFLAIASHELKTPLTNLSLNLQLVERKLDSPEKLARALKTSHKQVDRLKDLIENLMDVSLMRTGKFNFHFEEVNLSVVVRSMLNRLEDDMQKAKCQFNYEIQENIIGPFDALRVEQVLFNLLSNAIKYAPGKKVLVRLMADEIKVTMIVSDSGPGISKEMQLKIFERYERGNNLSAKGLGLGLFIVKEIMEGHQGSVRLENGVEGGAQFTLEFPLV